MTTLNGAQSPEKSDFAGLAGREVVIWADNDTAGPRLCAKGGKVGASCRS